MHDLAATTTSPTNRHALLGALAVAALALGLYAPTLGHGLVYDDHLAIERNPAVQRADLALIAGAGFWGPAEADRVATWRPLVTATFALDTALGRQIGAGAGAIVLHGVNVLLFAGVCLALMWLCLALGATPLTATAAGLLLAAHPLCTEATAWLVGRADLMLALFGMLFLRAWVRGRSGAATALFAAALLCKETALVLPVAAGLWGLAGQKTSPPRQAWAALGGVVALWLVGRLAIFGTLLGPAPSVLENPTIATDVAGRLWAALLVWGLGGRLLLWPQWLATDYGLAHFPALSPSWLALLGLTLALGTALAWWRWGRRAPAVAALLGVIAAPALLFSHLVSPLPTAFAERLWLLPAAGLCGLVAWGAARLVARIDAASGAGPAARQATGAGARTAAGGAIRLGLAVGLAAVVTLGGWAVRARLPDWSDDAAVYEAMVRDAPDSYRGLVNSASIQLEAGALEVARQRLQRAAGLHRDTALAWLSLARLETAAGRRTAAEDALRVAAEVGGETDELSAARCAAQLRFADQETALKTCAAAARPTRRGLDPERVMYHAMALDRAGQAEAAAAEMRRALSAAPAGEPPFLVLLNAGIFHARRQAWSEARVLLSAALRQRPGHLPARETLDSVCERGLLALQHRGGAADEAQRQAFMRCLARAGGPGDLRAARP